MTCRFLGLATAGILALSVSVQSQVATFSARLEVVRVDALVTEKGQIVRGLRAGDFELRDNGVLQQVEFVSFEELPLNLILALDASSSVSGERLQHLQTAGRAALAALKPDDRTALLTFSHVVALREPLTGDAARVRSALDSLESSGQTSLVDGSFAALMLAEPGGARRNLVIVFSDGHDTSSWLLGDGVLESARRSNATAYGVSVRGPRRPQFLAELSRVTGGSLLEIESMRDLPATFVRILDEFRQRYVVGYTPRGVAPDGWHRLEVRVKGRRADVRARAGYSGDP